jgi:hypothetical protein
VHFVYPNRDRDWTADDRYERGPDVDDGTVDVTEEVTKTR